MLVRNTRSQVLYDYYMYETESSWSYSMIVTWSVYELTKPQLTKVIAVQATYIDLKPISCVVFLSYGVVTQTPTSYPLVFYTSWLTMWSPTSSTAVIHPTIYSAISPDCLVYLLWKWQLHFFVGKK